MLDTEEISVDDTKYQRQVSVKNMAKLKTNHLNIDIDYLISDDKFINSPQMKGIKKKYGFIM